MAFPVLPTLLLRRFPVQHGVDILRQVIASPCPLTEVDVAAVAPCSSLSKDTTPCPHSSRPRVLTVQNESTRVSLSDHPCTPLSSLKPTAQRPERDCARVLSFRTVKTKSVGTEGPGSICGRHLMSLTASTTTTAAAAALIFGGR